MKNLVIFLFRSLFSGFRNRQSLVLENTALRQQLDVLHRQVKRPRVDPAVQALIKAMWRDNPTWGSPRIRGDLAKLDIPDRLEPEPA
jgi:hypothetical protein